MAVPERIPATSAPRAFGWLAAAIVASGCAAHAPPMHHARLQVERRDGGARAFLRATVAGRPMRFLVDTGAYRSLLPGGFVRAQRLRRGRESQAAQGVDVNGQVRTLSFLPDVPVTFEGEAAGGTLDFYMNNALDEDGILVPQELVGRGQALVIDLEGETLSLEREEDALARLGPSLREVPFERCLEEGLFERVHRIVPARVNGVPVRMLVDTGAEITALARNNRALPSLAATLGDRGTVVGMVSRGQMLQVDGVPVELAGTRFDLRPMVLPASDICDEGALGADVLGRCTLVWGYARLWVACRPPPPPGP